MQQEPKAQRSGEDGAPPDEVPKMGHRRGVGVYLLISCMILVL